MSRFTHILSLAFAFLFSFISAIPVNGSASHAEAAVSTNSIAAVSGYRNAGYFVNWYDVHLCQRHFLK